MRSIKGSLVGLVVAGILTLAPTAVFARGGGFGGGGHGFGGGGFGGGGHGFGGGHFGAAHFRGGHFGNFAGHGFSGHSFAFHSGVHYGSHYWHGGHWYGGRRHGYPYWDGVWWYGDPYWNVDPYYYYDDNDGDYSDAETLPPDAVGSQQTGIAVQKELAKLGYYHGPIDGMIGPETRKAIRWFQSEDKLPVTGLIDSATLKGLQIS